MVEVAGSHNLFGLELIVYNSISGLQNRQLIDGEQIVILPLEVVWRVYMVTGDQILDLDKIKCIPWNLKTGF